MSLLRASVTSDALGTNHLHNGALLTDLTGWNVSSDGGPDTPTLTYVAAADLPAPSPIGMGGAGKVTWTGPNTGSPFPAGLTWTSDALVAGQTVTLSIWVYVPADGSGDVRLLADGAVGDDSTTTGQWEQLTMTFSPTTTAPVMAIWSSATPPTAGQSFYFTGGMISVGDTAPTFAIGGGAAGDDVPILVDGSDTAVTASGLSDYTPWPGDRVLVQKVNGAVEVVQFLSRTAVPYASTGDVSTAWTLANAAQTSANGKNTIHYSTATPSGTPVDGDVWFQFSGAIIIGQWVGSGGVWDPTTIDNAVIANLDAGKITTGILEGIVIHATDGSGNTTVDIDGATGNVTIQGEFGTNIATAAGVHISSNTFTGIYGTATYPTIEWNNGAQGVAGNRQPMIYTDTTGGSNLYMWGGAGSTSRMAQVKLDVGRARIGIETSPGTNECDGDRIDIQNGSMIFYSNGTITFENVAGTAFQNIECSDATITGTAAISGNCNVSGHVNAGAEIQCNGSIQTSASAFQMTTAGGSGWKDLNCGNLNSNGSIMATNNLGFQGPTTGSFTANVNWNSASGNFRINTSSRRFKENIEDADLDTAKILALRPRSFERNDEEDGEGNPVRTGHRYVGFIAEEAADLGLEEFVVRDAEGVPWSFAYDYWAVAQQAVIREQAQQITSLQQTVADLAARLDRLEQSAR